MTTKSNPKSLNASSQKYGPCELCAKHASEVFIYSVGPHCVFGHEGCFVNKTGNEIVQMAADFRKVHHGSL